LGWRAATSWLDVILNPDPIRAWDAPSVTAWITRRREQFAASVTERVRLEMT
jgi:hypothetical protein